MRPKIAFFDYCDVFEDFYPHYGVDQSAFSRTWSSGGNHAFVRLVQREVGDVTWYELALRPDVPEGRHELLGCRVRFVPPGDQFSEATLQDALRLGLSFVDSYCDRFCWCQHVCSAYLNEPAASWFEAGLPVVGYFHDYELSTHGALWMPRWLDAWQAAGAARFMDFRELAAAVGRRLEITAAGTVVTLEEANAPALVRPLRVALRVSPGVPSVVTVRRGHEEEYLEPFRVAAGHSVIEIPPRVDCAPSGVAAKPSRC